MPFLKGGITLTVLRQNVNQPKHNMHDKHRWGGKGPERTKTFYISIQKKSNPSSVLYQRIYYSHRKNSEKVCKILRRGAVESVRLLQFNTVMLALIPDKM